MKKANSENVCTFGKASLGFVLALFMAACSTTDGTHDAFDTFRKIQDGSLFSEGGAALEKDAVKLESDTFSQEKIVVRVSRFYDLNPNYRSLAKALTDAGFSSAAYSLEARKLSTQALEQSRLPQARPDITLDQDGQAVGRLLFEQLLIGSGRLRAEKLILNAQEAQALAEYRIEANDDLASGIAAYLSFCRFKKLADESNKVVSLYESFLEKANARVRGGAANRNEARLFELKTAQAKAQQKEFVAEYERYKARLASLTGSYVPIESASRFEFSDLSEGDNSMTSEHVKRAPVYQLQLAMLDQSVGEVVREKVSRRPELSLTGAFGAGSQSGLGADNNINNVRLGLTVSKPMVWGKDLNLKAVETNVEAAKADAQRQLKNTAIELQVLDELLKSYQAQLLAKKSVADLAEQRALSFEKDFKAGAVGIVEAVSVLETVNTVKLDYIDMQFLVLEAELLKAQTLGLLGPLPSTPTLKQ